MTDPFRNEREQLERVRRLIVENDLAVSLGEWQAETLFADPKLAAQRHTVEAARGSLDAATLLLDRAIQQLQPAGEELADLGRAHACEIGRVPMDLQAAQDAWDERGS